MMARTFCQDFARDDGRWVTVEFSYAGGSDTTYSPMNGACGGDGCEVEIISVWPNSEAYERFAGVRNRLQWPRRPHPLWRRPFAWLALAGVELVMWVWERFYRLSDTERERMEAWIAEHHVDDPYEPEDYL
jgi:hypothetical protein